MQGRLNGRVALVTGGAAGLGQAYGVRLAEDGAKVVIADTSPADETVALIEQAGGEAIGIRCDVSSGEQVAEMVAAGIDRFGAIDILVHNAGVYPFHAFLEMTFEDWRRVMSINLDSAFHLCQGVLPGMTERGWGRIICVATSAFYSGAPRLSHYVASKGGVIGFVRALATDVGVDGITVNAVAPGLVRTPGTAAGGQEEMGLFEMAPQMQAIKRVEMPEDMIGTVSFLASDEAAFMTGQTLVVDGGLVRS